MKREVAIGHKRIGGNNPILIQSMTNTKTEDAQATIKQILELEEAGCDLVRVTVNTQEAADALPLIKESIHIPLVADIHFNGSLALSAMEAGADKIRINPGNLDMKHLLSIIEMAKDKGISIRIGVNSGSIKKELIQTYGHTPEAMLHSMKEFVSFFEEHGFFDLVLSAKDSDVRRNIAINRLLHEHFEYPIHLGVTEAGIGDQAIVKSAIGIGVLLAEGIGSTIRVSTTGSPVNEIPVARYILQSLGLRKGLNVISCPTCGRTEINVEALSKEISKRLSRSEKDLDVAVMGCVVNGPGEAKEADIGIAGGRTHSLIFKKGEIIGKYDNTVVKDIFIAMVEDMIHE